jgi:transposase InsO family protein
MGVNAMSLARLVVTAVRVEGRSKSAVSREYKVSRRWVHELVRRFDAEGEAGLEPRSRRPHHSPARVVVEVEEAIVGWRKQLSEQGLDAGAATIAVHVADQFGKAPSTATIWRVLSRRGMVVAQPHKRPRSSYIRFQAELPNQRWQADTTHWQLADGSGVEILDVIDDHSRYAIAATARPVFKAADVVAAFLRAADRHGLPESLLTDNGAIFTAAPRGGRCALETELATLGVRYTHSRPYHPQTCGKVERFHQTLKRWLARQDPAGSLAQLQAQLDTFADYYNQIRPHRAVGRKPPATAYTARPKAVPTPPTPAPTTPAAHHRVRVDRIDTTGVVTLRHNSRLHHIGIGRKHAGMRVTLLVADLHIRIITDDGQLLRELTLDPTRDYQPQHHR